MNYIKYIILLTLLISLMAIQETTAQEDPFFINIDAIESPILIVDKNDGQILRANEAAGSFYGYEIAELLSMSLFDLTETEEVITLDEYLALNENNIFIHQTATGYPIYVEVTASDIEYDGETVSYIVIADRTELQDGIHRGQLLIIALITLGVIFLLLSVTGFYIITQNNRVLRKTKKQFQVMYEVRRAFNDGLLDLLYLKDENFKYIFVNEAVESFYDRPSAQIVGYDDYHLSDKSFADLIRATDEKVLKLNQRSIEHIFYKDRVYLTTKFPVPLENNAVGVGAYVKDITESYYLKAESEKVLERQEILLNTIQTTYEKNEQQYDKVLEGCLKLTDSSLGIVVHTDKLMRDFRTLASRGCEENCDCAKLLEEAINEPVFKALLLNENKTIYDNNPKFSVEQNSVKRFVCVPVTSKKQMVALVFIGNKETPYNKQDVNHLELLIGGAFFTFNNKRITDAIYKERLKYYQILKTIDESIITVNKNQIINYINDKALSLLNTDEVNVMRMPFKDIFTMNPTDKTIKEPLKTAIKDKTAIQFQGTIKNKLNNEEIGEYTILLNPIIVSGKPNGIVITINKSA